MKKTSIKIIQTFLRIFEKTIHYTLIALLIFFLWVSLVYPHIVKDLLHWLEQSVNNLGNWNYLVVVACWVLESLPLLWVIIPWQNMVIIIWWFFGKSHIISLIIIATISVYVWHVIGYLAWKKYWLKIIEKLWPSVWFSKNKIEILEIQMEKRWGLFLVLWTFYNMTRAFVPFIAWAMNMEKRKFAFYNFIWSLLWAVVVIVIWVMFSSHYELLVEKLPKIIILSLLIFLVVYFIEKKFWIKNSIRKRLRRDT